MKSLRRRVLRRMVRILFPAASRQGLHAYSLFSRFDALPRLEAEVPGCKVLVLAPHPDDEVFGCGGALAKHVQAGAQITVVYMTDGRKGDPSVYGRPLSEEDLWKAEQDVVARRKCEAEEAAKVLGVHKLVFLNFPDGALQSSQKAVEELQQVLLSVEPDRVYLPSLLENHPDHWQTNCVFSDAICNGTRTLPQFSCWGYEIWPPVYANRIIDISDVMEIKIQAINVFQSQRHYMDYARGITSLNSYRSFFHHKAKGYAEAFFSCQPEDYLALFRRMRACREGLRTPRVSPVTDLLIASRD